MERYILVPTNGKLYIEDTQHGVFHDAPFSEDNETEALRRVTILNQQSKTGFHNRHIRPAPMHEPKGKATPVRKSSLPIGKKSINALLKNPRPIPIPGQTITTKSGINVVVFGDPVRMKNVFTGKVEWMHVGVDAFGYRTVVYLDQIKEVENG